MLGERRAGVSIPITVIGGYLGAGKTTLLNALLANPGGRRIGVVVNDFGALGVDAGLVRSDAGDSPVVNLANGCVCCTLGDDLGATLQILAEIEPPIDHIVVEASGVADPSLVAAWGTVPPFLPGGVVVAAAADSVRRSARDRYVGKEVVRQLSAADLIIVTKVDTVSAKLALDVDDWIRTTSGAPTVNAVLGDIDPDVVLGPVTGRAEVPGRTGSPTVSTPVAAENVMEHAASSYVKWAWVAVDAVEVAELGEFLEHLPEGVLRLKGVVPVIAGGDVEHHLVQVVGRTHSTVAAPSSAPVGIEAIGVAGVLDITKLEASAVRYLQQR